ncbi:hypothetical protein FLAG1_10267 [Fusarium langsethiae]|uniref:Uncharacterized protein n=1 Tax=Fusarium langsethiae TaxID=179993 RepID=A0A0M9EPI0_FUSLA|nr:hypothetical protein FLAG1_10267 [Fusarium langsethiae]GKU07352.1 unnamed protein product [Fusarium langsethiae]
MYRLLLTAKESSHVFEEEFNYFTKHHQDPHRSSLLHVAAYSGYEDICCELIEKYNYSVDWKSYNGETAIQIALSWGRIGLANRLKVDWGASLTPEIDILRAIVGFNYAEHVKSGLQMYKNDWGCDINAVDETGNSIFHHNEFSFPTMRAMQELGFAVDWNWGNMEHRTFLHGNIIWLSNPMLLNMFLLHSRFSINTRDVEGRTPLHHLLNSMRYLDFPHINVDLLLDFGADRSLRDNRGQLAIDIAHKQLDQAQKDLKVVGIGIMHNVVLGFIKWLKKSIELLTDYTTVAMDVREVDLRLDDHGPGWYRLS